MDTTLLLHPWQPFSTVYTVVKWADVGVSTMGFETQLSEPFKSLRKLFVGISQINFCNTAIKLGKVKGL